MRSVPNAWTELDPPPVLLAAALALWSWASGQWVVGAFLAIVLEGPRVLPLAVAINHTAFRRLGVATRVALFGVLAWEFSHRPLPLAMLAMLGWAPAIFAPLLFAQRISAAGTIPLDALRMRRSGLHAMQSLGAGGPASERVDISYFYVCATLLAAAGAAQGRNYFFSALVVVVAIALFVAPARGRLIPAALMFAIAVTIGQLGHLGLASLQHRVEEGALNLLGEWLANTSNTDRSRTRIGDLGRVKLSDRILMRVVFGAGTKPPLLLRDGGYSVYEGGTWTNPSIERVQLTPAGAERRFALDSEALQASTTGNGLAELPALTIAMRLPSNAPAAIAVPHDTSRIERLAANTIVANGRGGLLAQSDARYVQFDVWRGGMGDADPGAEDLAIPPSLRPTLDRVFAELGLPESATPAVTLDTIQRFFTRYFRYTLFLGSGSQGARSLADFLAVSRAGHCEYFASATVFLLRRAGIPARYTTGYAVEEWSELDRQFVVRARHGHAWALAFVGGRWVELDTTPSEWANIEERETRTIWLPLIDLYSSLRERLDRWRAEGAPVPRRVYWGLGAIVLIVLAWRTRRLFARPTRILLERFERRKRERAMRAAAALAPIEAYFAARGLPRGDSCGWQSWAEELRRSGLVQGNAMRALDALVKLHYRRRFGPPTAEANINASDAARAWLRAYSASLKTPGD